MKRTKGYMVVMSSGEPLQIDQDEVDKVIECVNTGKAGIFKRGALLNPNHAITIVPDYERVKEWKRMCDYTDGSGDKAKEEGLRELKSVWEGTRTRAERAITGSEVKQLP